MSGVYDSAAPNLNENLAGVQAEQAADRLLRELKKGLDSVQKDSDWLSEAEVRRRLGLKK